MKLEVTSEKVLEAAKQCPDAAKVLETLFPSAFPTNIVPPMDGANGIKVRYQLPYHVAEIQLRLGGEYKKQGLYLQNVVGYAWEIVKDNEAHTVLLLRAVSQK